MSTWKAVGFVLAVGAVTAAVMPPLLFFVRPTWTAVGLSFFAVLFTVVLAKILERLYALHAKLDLIGRDIAPPGGPLAGNPPPPPNES